MIETITLIGWIVFIAFLTTMIIVGHIVDRRERKKRLEAWAEFERVFSECFREKEEEIAEPQPPTREYEPVCPRGYEDCIWDPARIQCKNPEWYKRLYGDMTPEEAVNAPTGCKDKVKEDPDEKYYCYDDEDK